LIDRLATQIWELRDGKLHTFKGSYREYILRRVALTPSAPARQIILPPKPMVRDNSKETRRRALALEQLEERIREQESLIQRLSAELQRIGSNGREFDRMQKISWQVAQAQASLEQLLGEWEKTAV
jgi:ATPase subunit of ABC transporter with duplicated ATPase domains